jgi:hypothetical protein
VLCVNLSLDEADVVIFSSCQLALLFVILMCGLRYYLGAYYMPASGSYDCTQSVRLLDRSAKTTTVGDGFG